MKKQLFFIRLVMLVFVAFIPAIYLCHRQVEKGSKENAFTKKLTSNDIVFEVVIKQVVATGCAWK